MGVSNFDPHKFNGLNKAVNGQLVTNQIEWNPVCFEHFNSGMMDDLTASGIHPMIWSTGLNKVSHTIIPKLSTTF